MAMPGMSAGVQPGMDPSMDPNIDLEGQVRDGVQAFVQSQDPAIAVEVVNMLAQMMGIAPDIDPFASEAQAPAVEQEVPIARRGMRLRMYRRGGIISKYRKGGEGPASSKGGKGSASSKGGEGSASPRGLANLFVDPKATPVSRVDPVTPPDLQIDTFGNITDQSMRQPAAAIPDGLTIPGGYTLEDLGLAGRRGSPLTQDLINYRFALKRQNAATIKNTPASYTR